MLPSLIERNLASGVPPGRAEGLALGLDGKLLGLNTGGKQYSLLKGLGQLALATRPPEALIFDLIERDRRSNSKTNR